MSNPFVTHPVVTSTLEWFTLSIVGGFHGFLAITEALSESDWRKLTGENGVIFLLAIVGLAFWGKAVKDDRLRVKEDEAKERRHSEALQAADGHFKLLIEMNNKNADDLKNLTMESITANINGTHELSLLRKELAARPCAIRAIPPLPINEVS